jgi:hypothetical protein
MNQRIHPCTCEECINNPIGETAMVHAGINLMVATLDEKNRRRFAGLWASQLGYGGVQAIASITGLSRTTITRGQREVAECASDADSRVRAPGGGRKRAEKKTRRSLPRSTP